MRLVIRGRGRDGRRLRLGTGTRAWACLWLSFGFRLLSWTWPRTGLRIRHLLPLVWFALSVLRYSARLVLIAIARRPATALRNLKFVLRRPWTGQGLHFGCRHVSSSSSTRDRFGLCGCRIASIALSSSFSVGFQCFNALPDLRSVSLIQSLMPAICSGVQ